MNIIPDSCIRRHHLVSSVLLVISTLGGSIPFVQAANGKQAKIPMLTHEQIWSDRDSQLVFEESFDSVAGLQPTLSGKATFNGPLAAGGYDGGNCWMMEFELPAKSRAMVNLPMSELDATGLYYSFLLKIETDPAFGPTDLALSINMGSHPFAHSVYRLLPLEEPILRTGTWMSEIWPVWKGHSNEVYRGWTRIEGDTSAYFGRKPPADKFKGIVFYLSNRSEEDRQVKLYCDDIKVVRREVADSAQMTAVLNTPRPIINYTREQILRARALAADSSEAALPRMAGRHLQQADEWLQRDITVPRKQAGYPTKYTCDDCKAFLRSDPPTGYICTKCDKKHTGELYDKLLAYDRHKELGQAAHALGFAWQWTDDQRYARRAEEILLAYADAIPHFQLGHNWLGTCWLVEDFLFAYDYVYEWVSEASRTRIDNDFLKTIRRLYHYNHHYPEGYSRLWQVCAWISILTKDVDWIQYLNFSAVGNREVLLNYGLTADMISLKGPAYHGDIVRALNRMGKTLENCGIRFFDDRVRPVYDVVFKQIFPDRSLTAFGHSNVGYSAAGYDYFTPYLFYRDPRYLVFCSQEVLAENRYFHDLELPEADDLPGLPSSHLEALGLTMLRTQPDNDTVLALSWGAPQRNDPTRLDFQLYGGGGHVIWSSGTTYYGNPLMDSWYLRSLSRNMIVVDQGTQTAVAGEYLFLQTDAEVQIVAAELRNAYPDTRIVRIALLFNSGEAALIDLFASSRPRTLDWVCQLPGEVTSTADWAAVNAPLGTENGYEVLKNVRRAGKAERPVLVLRQPADGRGVKLTAAPGSDTTFFLADTVTGHQSKPSSVCLFRREAVKHTGYATLLQPFQEVEGMPAAGEIEISSIQQAADQFHFSKVEVKLELPGGTHIIEVSERPVADDTYEMDIVIKPH